MVAEETRKYDGWKAKIFIHFHPSQYIYLFNMFPNPYFVHPCYLQQGYPYYWMPLPENLKQ